MVHHLATIGQRRRVGAAMLLAGMLAMLPQRAAAVNLAGRWLFEVDGTADIVQITQAGDVVTIPITIASQGSVQLTGPVTAPGEFDLTVVGHSSPSFFGRLLADAVTSVIARAAVGGGCTHRQIPAAGEARLDLTHAVATVAVGGVAVVTAAARENE